MRRMLGRSTLVVFGILTMIIVPLPANVTTTAQSDSIYVSVPPSIDPSRKYLFFLHVLIPELQGRNAVSPVYGRYYYDVILKALALRGFVVISEVRPRGTQILEYARKVTGQVRVLMEGGVPPENITIAGSSKGGEITLATSAELGQPKVNFVVMAGCFRTGAARSEYEALILPMAPRMQGHMLSLYDEVDDQAGSCQEEVFVRASRLEHKEIKLQAGLGHALFFAPYKEWLDLVSDWASKR